MAAEDLALGRDAERLDRAFEKLYAKYRDEVYRYTLMVLRNAADADDVTQTTFLNAYRAFQRGDRPEKPRNWLIAISHNVCRERFRQAKRRPAEVELEDRIPAAEASEDGPSPVDIRRALAQLNFNQRTALVMRELEGRSYDEIAEALGVSFSAVETLLFRARRAIREQLEGELTCAEAVSAISGSLDVGRGALRAHLRACKECSTLERRERSRRSALSRLAGFLPMPSWLSSLFGGGGTAAEGAAAAGVGVAAKAAIVVAVGLVTVGVGYEGAVKAGITKHHRAPAVSPAAPAGEQMIESPVVIPWLAPRRTRTVPRGVAAAPPNAVAHSTQAKAHAHRIAPGPGAGTAAPPSSARTVGSTTARGGSGGSSASPTQASSSGSSASQDPVSAVTSAVEKVAPVQLPATPIVSVPKIEAPKVEAPKVEAPTPPAPVPAVPAVTTPQVPSAPALPPPPPPPSLP